MKITRENNKMASISPRAKDTLKPPTLLLLRYLVNKWDQIVLKKYTNINQIQKWNYLIIVSLKNKVTTINILHLKNKLDLP